MDNMELQELKKLALAATPGPWTSIHHSVVEDNGGHLICPVNNTRGKYEYERANRDFIAAANPAAVLELIELAERAMEAPADPLDMKLPCDIKVGGGTIGKGCTLRTLVKRMEAMEILSMAAADKAELAQGAAFWQRVEEIRAERATAAPTESVDTPELWSLIATMGHTERRGRDDSTARAGIVAHVNAWDQQRYEAGRHDIEGVLTTFNAMRERAERAEAALEKARSDRMDVIDQRNAMLQRAITAEAAQASRPAVDLSATDVRMLNVVGRYLTMKDESPKCSADLLNLAGRIQAMLPRNTQAPVVHSSSCLSVGGGPGDDHCICGAASGNVEAPTASTAAADAAVCHNCIGTGIEKGVYGNRPCAFCTDTRAASNSAGLRNPEMSDAKCREELVDRLVELLDAKEAMRARGITQDIFPEMFAQFVAAFDARSPTTPIAGDMQTTASADGLPPLPWDNAENNHDIAAWIEVRSDDEIAEAFHAHARQARADAIESALNSCITYVIHSDANFNDYPDGLVSYFKKHVEDMRTKARADALEEAESLCEAYAADKWSLYKGRAPYTGREDGRGSDITQGQNMGAEDCAEAIRALNKKGGA